MFLRIYAVDKAIYPTRYSILPESLHPSTKSHGLASCPVEERWKQTQSTLLAIKGAKVTQLKIKRKNEKVHLPRSVEENSWDNLLSSPEERNSEWSVGRTAHSQSKELDIPLTNTGVHTEQRTCLVRKESHILALVFCCCIYNHHSHQKINATKWKKFHLSDFITTMLESWRWSIQATHLEPQSVTITFTHHSAACRLWFTPPFIHQQVSEALCISPVCL